MQKSAVTAKVIISVLSVQVPRDDGTQALEHTTAEMIIFAAIVWDESLGKITCHNKLQLVYPLENGQYIYHIRETHFALESTLNDSVQRD